MVGPGTLHRFPTKFQAAARQVLLVAAHGQHVCPETLAPEQLAALCAWRAQQLLQRAVEVEAVPPAELTAQQVHDRLDLRHWAERRGLAPPLRSPELPRRGGRGAPEELELQQEVQRAARTTERIRRELEQRRARRGGGVVTDLRQLEGLEARLNAALQAGAMAGPPALPAAPHPLRGLPEGCAMRILQLAAYPLSAWVQAEDMWPGGRPPRQLAPPFIDSDGGPSDAEGDGDPDGGDISESSSDEEGGGGGGGGAGGAASISEEESSSDEEEGGGGDQQDAGGSGAEGGAEGGADDWWEEDPPTAGTPVVRL